jgi:hypothetical protein
MYINSRVYLQRSQVGLDLKNLIDLGGSCKICKTQKKIWEIHLLTGGYPQSGPIFFFPWTGTAPWPGATPAALEDGGASDLEGEELG